MNCCGNHNHNDRNIDHQKNSKRHGPHAHPIWMMAICCGAPVILLAVISILSASSSMRAFLYGMLPYICPVMMLAMIPMMLLSNRKNKDSRGSEKENSLQDGSHKNN